MHIVEPYAKIIRFMGTPGDNIVDQGVEAVRFIEETGRKCYRSEGASTNDSFQHFLSQHTLNQRHTSMLRFSCVVVDFMVDRGVAQEITRHGKSLDFQHESQRYCNYSKDKFGNSIGFIQPRGFDECQTSWWIESMKSAEERYFLGLSLGLKPQIAADALPRATASLLTAVGNLQTWRHFLLTRTTKQCHPKMTNVTVDHGILTPEIEGLDTDVSDQRLRNSSHPVGLLTQFQQTFPLLFDDIEPYGDHVQNMQKAR